ncbi:MAG TPA: RNA-binding protein [Saprospiraceae bacterium]|nr:RNA-binding protein [Saprospiraceae bacterium]HMP14271.1 RNA-binding protein [Saprospiraceae bacterium]
MRIFVGNLSYKTTDDELATAFEAYGEVSSASILLDRDTGRSKGIGFVDMPNSSEAEAAIEGLDGADLGGRNIKVEEARPPRPRR